jgi:hypothetical protein
MEDVGQGPSARLGDALAAAEALNPGRFAAAVRLLLTTGCDVRRSLVTLRRPRATSAAGTDRLAGRAGPRPSPLFPPARRHTRPGRASGRSWNLAQAISYRL